MSGLEFMKELEYLLSDLPDEEKEDALAYYRDYLEEAGAAESQVLGELGSPERIAAIIRADIRGDLKDGGAFTERGFEDERFREPGYQVARRMDLPEEQESTAEETSDGEEKKAFVGSGDGAGHQGKPEDTRRGQRNIWKILLIVLLVLAASPVLLAVGGSLFGVGVGIVTTVLVVVGVCLFLAAILTMAFVIGGLTLLVLGLVKLFSQFASGLLLVGIALVMLAFGILGIVLSVWIYGKIIPALFRGCINGINRLIHRRVRRV